MNGWQSESARPGRAADADSGAVGAEMEESPRPGQAKVDEHTPVRSPYHTPVLRLRGSLARLTQAIGSLNGDAGQGMMA